MDTVTVAFDQNDLNALTFLLDAAVKSLGMSGAEPALLIHGKIKAAVDAANAAKASKAKEETV